MKVQDHLGLGFGAPSGPQCEAYAETATLRIEQQAILPPQFQVQAGQEPVRQLRHARPRFPDLRFAELNADSADESAMRFMAVKVSDPHRQVKEN